MAHKVDLIWQCRSPWERDWIRFVLSRFDVSEIDDHSHRIITENSITVMSANVGIPSSYVQLVAKTRRCILYHISDESLNSEYSCYKAFDFVFRNYWSSVFGVDKIKVLPLGYASGTQVCRQVRAAAERKYLWSFAGSAKASRPEMLKALTKADPKFVHVTSGLGAGQEMLDKERYQRVLEDSVFCPCPMGNVNLETFRLYEALEAGCIPIVEARPFIRYFEGLFGMVPFPSVRAWSEAPRLMGRLRDNPVALDAKQRQVSEWWQAQKTRLRCEVSEVVEECFFSGREPGKVVRPMKPVAALPGWRLAELLRHHSPAAVLRRLGIVAYRL